MNLELLKETCPSGWQISVLEKASRISNNLRFPINADQRKEMKGVFPYYGPTKVLDYINEYRVEGKYVLMSEDGDHFLKYDEIPMTLLVEGKFNVNNHAHLIQGNDECLTEWIFYFYNHVSLEPYITRQGVGRFKLTKDALLNLPILIPPIPEQEKIIKVLSTWDRRIELTTNLIKAKRNLKRALMQHLLTGKRRFQEFVGQPWEEFQLVDVFERVTRKNDEGNTNVVTISAQRGFVRQDEFFNRIVASENLAGYFLVKKGEFCYNKSYTNDYAWGATKRLKEFEKAVVTTLYICFRIKDESRHSGDFLEQLFEACMLDKGLTKIAHEGGRAHGLLNVTPSDFFSLKITIPGYDEQVAIAKVLQAADREIELLKKQLDALKRQKRSLMQKLLTGQIRVKTADENREEMVSA
jgi:type I restriction enzyme, S subunit